MRWNLLLPVLIAVVSPAWGQGLLMPQDRRLPPLVMVRHHVAVDIEDQVAVTRVEQVFRNDSDRQLEATYVFPLPGGASVNKFTMWVDGKETTGELVEAGKARTIYNSIVRRTQDPGLLEYVGSNLLQLRVFPVPPRGEQKVALRYTAVARRDAGVVEYVYPFKTDGKGNANLRAFSIKATIKSQHGVTNVYSPTHSISIKRASDKEVSVKFDQSQGVHDKDFQLFYATGDKDIGLTALMHRPLSTENGFFTLLITPRAEIASAYKMPRDVVLVLDTSGSMRGPKMEQARKALRFCLENLGPSDRFGLINFATTVNKYRDDLTAINPENLAAARKWIDGLDATGGTAIADALAASLEFRGKDDGRTFTIVFFTDGQPTIGTTDPDAILKATAARNSANTRIFTFGVGDDVNATMLDQLADMSRAVSTYVRPEEDIEAKVSSLFGKMSSPVLTNLKLTAGNDVRLVEVYPPQLPDLFQGSQLVVLGRFSGRGPAAITLTGMVGKDPREFVYEVSFPEKTGGERDFVEQLWARRKVGFMLDQIRANGEKKELVDEVVALAKKYGIATPYTSYLIVPDSSVPVVPPLPRPRPFPRPLPVLGAPPAVLAPRAPGEAPRPLEEFARTVQNAAGDGLAKNRERFAEKELRGAGGQSLGFGGRAAASALEKKAAYDRARDALRRGEREALQAGKLGVDLSVQMQNLRKQSRLDQAAVRRVQNRNLVDLGSVWIDEEFKPTQKTFVVKAQSDAWFRLLERKPELKDVLRLGNHIVWVTPSNVALVIDTSAGQEKVADKDIDALFVTTP